MFSINWGRSLSQNKKKKKDDSFEMAAKINMT